MEEIKKLKILQEYLQYDRMFGVEYQMSDSFFSNLSIDFFLNNENLSPTITSSLDSFSKNERSDHRSHSRIIREIKEVKEKLGPVASLIGQTVDLMNSTDVDYNKVIFTLMSTKLSIGDSMAGLGEILENIDQLKLSFFNESFIRKIDIHIDEYKNYAKFYKINIDKESVELDSFLNNIKNFNFYQLLENEVKDLYNSFDVINQKLQKINEKSKKARPQLIELHSLFKETINASQNTNNLYNKTENNCCYTTLKTQGVFDNINGLLEIMANVYMKTLNSDDYICVTEAEVAYKTSKNNPSDLTSFINKKNNDNAIDFILEVENNPKYSSIVVYEDLSLIVKNKKNELILIKDANQAAPIIHDIFNTVVTNKLKKNPFVAKEFKNTLANRYIFIEECLLTADTFLNNEAILKANSFDVIEHLKGRRDFENLDDKMNECVLNHKITKYAHSIISNKYKHLYNDESYTIIKGLYDLNVEQSILQDMIGKKLSAFHDTASLNEGLNKLLNSFSSFTIENYIESAKRENANIVYQDDSLLILEIDDFNKSKQLGSNSWCISRSDYYFKSYTENGNHQYFIYDFNKSIKDIHSMIGLTLEADGSYNTAHLKNDDHKSLDIELTSLQLKIITNQINKYPNLTTELQEEINSLKKERSTRKVITSI